MLIPNKETFCNKICKCNTMYCLIKLYIFNSISFAFYSVRFVKPFLTPVPESKCINCCDRNHHFKHTNVNLILISEWQVGTFIGKSFRLNLGVISRKDCIMSLWPFLFYCYTSLKVELSKRFSNKDFIIKVPAETLTSVHIIQSQDLWIQDKSDNVFLSVSVLITQIKIAGLNITFSWQTIGVFRNSSWASFA